MSLTQKVAINTIVQVIGKAVTTAISLVLIAAITRYLGVSGYGEYTTIFAYVSFWAVLADFGFFWILVREISQPQAEINKIFQNIITLRTCLGIVIFSLSFLVAQFIPSYSSVVKLGIGACAAGWFWMTLNSTLIGVFQANLKMYYAVITDVIGRIIILALVLMMIKLNQGLITIIWVYFLGNLINWLGSLYLARSLVRFRLAFDFPLWKKYFYEAVSMGLVLIFGYLYFKTDTVVLSLLKSSQDVGIYGAPYKILEILLLIPGMFLGNVFPIISRYLTAKDSRLNSAVQKAFDFLSMAAVPVVVGGLVLAYPIIKFVAGQEFVQASTVGPLWGLDINAPLVLQILIITVGIYFISQLFTSTVIAMGRQKDLVLPYLFFALVNIGLNLLLIPKFSYLGSALATVITGLLVLLITIRIVKHYQDFIFHYHTLLKSIVAGLLMGLVLFYLSFNLFLSIIVGLGSYTAVLYLLGGINKEMLLAIFRKEV